jgi:hypothetical protein
VFHNRVDCNTKPGLSAGQLSRELVETTCLVSAAHGRIDGDRAIVKSFDYRRMSFLDNQLHIASSRRDPGKDSESVQVF